MIKIIYTAICLTAISYEDINKMIIPDIWLLSLAAEGLVCGIHPLAALVPIVLFVLTALVCALLDRPLPMGQGDAKLFAVIGLISGGAGLFFSYALASLGAGLFSATLLIPGSKTKRDRIAFGPFIAFSFMLWYTAFAD